MQRVKKTKPKQKQANYIKTLERYRDEIYNNMLLDNANLTELNEELKSIQVKIYNERKKLEYIIEGLPVNGVKDSTYNLKGSSNYSTDSNTIL